MEAFHNKECLGPPCGRRATLPDDVQRIALLCCPPINKQQTPERKNRIVRVMGVGRPVPGGFQSKKNPWSVLSGGKKNKTKGSEERTEGVRHLGQIILTRRHGCGVNMRREEEGPDEDGRERGQTLHRAPFR